MKISLISLPITEGDPEANLKKMESLFHNATKHKPDLICFPEMSVVNDGCPFGQYRHLAKPVPGRFSDIFCELAQTHQVHIALGLLERASDKFYSSTILIDPKGNILLKQRQLGNGKPYSCGKTFHVAQAAFGTVMFAVCADVWVPELNMYIMEHRPQYIIVPVDICGTEGENGLINCNRPPDDLVELKKQYMKISKLTGSKVLAVNCYCKDRLGYCCAFGGAFVFDNGAELFPFGFRANQWRQPINQPIYNYKI